jgi:nucleoside-diphosphate kinase
VKQQRWFLKRTVYGDIHLADLFVGASVNVYSRHLTIKDYADDFTRTRLQRDMER